MFSFSSFKRHMFSFICIIINNIYLEEVKLSFNNQVTKYIYISYCKKGDEDFLTLIMFVRRIVDELIKKNICY